MFQIEEHKVLCLRSGLVELSLLAQAVSLPKQTVVITLNRIIATGHRQPLFGQTTIQLVFIDADKPNYSNYYNLVFDKLRPGGFIIADNVLWSGKVLDDEKDENTQALDDFNKMVLADERVENVLLPIRDGLMIVRKK